jgi:hypothetical protein
MLDVTVVLLNDNYASTAIGPIEVFHSAGVLWNALRGEAPAAKFRVTVASLDGESVTSQTLASIRGPADLVRDGA